MGLDEIVYYNNRNEAFTEYVIVWRIREPPCSTAPE
jgi:hypothetical protein